MRCARPLAVLACALLLCSLAATRAEEGADAVVVAVPRRALLFDTSAVPNLLRDIMYALLRFWNAEAVGAVNALLGATF